MTDYVYAFIDPEILKNLRPLPGRCVIALDPIPEKIGAIFLPDTAREMQPTVPLHTGVILAMTGRRHHEKFKRTMHEGDCAVSRTAKLSDGIPHCNCGYQEPFRVGDRIVLDLAMEDLNKRLIVSMNARIRGVILL